MRIIIAALLILGCGGQLQAQLALKVGYMSGYSRQADALVSDEGFRVVEFGGYRMLVAYLEAAFGADNRLSPFVRQDYSPGVSTISPYKYLSSVGGLRYSPSESNIVVEAGGGYGLAKAWKKKIGSGAVYGLGVGIASESIELLARIYKGSMGLSEDLLFTVGLGWRFH